MPLRIPQENQEGIIKILGLESAALEQLISILSNAPPSLKPKPLVELLVSQASMEIPDAEVIVETITTLYGARAYFGFSAEEFAVELRESLEVSDIEKARVYAEGDDTEKNLSQLLSIEPLVTAMKAQMVFREYQRSYCGARVLTDLRPVFGNDVKQLPVGATVVHSLRIAYHEANELKEFFVALSGKEVQDLIDMLHRAQEKQQSLGHLLDMTKIARLDYKSGE